MPKVKSARSIGKTQKMDGKKVKNQNLRRAK